MLFSSFFFLTLVFFNFFNIVLSLDWESGKEQSNHVLANNSFAVCVRAITSAPAPRKAYNNQPIVNGEVLVPMMATEERINVMDICTANLRTWSMGGKKYRVMFYPVPAEYKDIAMTQFNAELNEFLSERRDARCMISQEDGTLKVCPKKMVIIVVPVLTVHIRMSNHVRTRPLVLWTPLEMNSIMNQFPQSQQKTQLYLVSSFLNLSMNSNQLTPDMRTLWRCSSMVTTNRMSSRNLN